MDDALYGINAVSGAATAVDLAAMGNGY